LCYVLPVLLKALMFCHRDGITSVTDGIKDYFNSMLGTQLLYKFERQQYSEAC